MRRALAGVALLLGLAAAAPNAAAGGTPVPWCGTTPSSVDRLPDATLGFAVHVLYVRPPGSPDRFAEFAPRLAGDAAEIDAWWRAQDPARAPRFDLFPAPGCASTFGALDITSAELVATSPRRGFLELSQQLQERGLDEPEKVYLAYYDGPTGQIGDTRICGVGSPRSRFGPALAVVYLDSCGAERNDDIRVFTAAHELVHALGAVEEVAPNHCNDGHVCDDPGDLMTARASERPLSTLRLDAGRDDYYGHDGGWLDVRDSLFLERLDSPDRAAPSVPTGLRIGESVPGVVQLTWSAATDDVGPVTYRVYENGRLLSETGSTRALVPEGAATASYSVRAADGAGRLGPLATARYRPGVGMVDASGRLVLDTVRPQRVTGVRVTRGKTTTQLRWPAARDAGGIRSYRVVVGARTIVVRRPAVVLARARVNGNVSIAAIDRAGNVGPAAVVPRARVR